MNSFCAILSRKKMISVLKRLQYNNTLFFSCSLQRYLGNVTRIPCSFSSSRCWCAFPVEEGDRTGHRAKLCVTNTVGSATSPEISFTLQGIRACFYYSSQWLCVSLCWSYLTAPLIRRFNTYLLIKTHIFFVVKPDPPTNVEVRPVEGRNNILKVSWSYPRTWKIGYYFLHFYLRYRPQHAEKVIWEFWCICLHVDKSMCILICGFDPFLYFLLVCVSSTRKCG